MKFFDIHSHLQFSQYDEDRIVVITNMAKEGIGSIVVGTDYNTSKQAVELAEQNENLFASVGLHPTDARKENFSFDKYKTLAQHKKVVAVGECGIDYYRIPTTNNQQSRRTKSSGRRSKASELTTDDIKKKQKETFENHIKLAVETNKPLMIHCRPSIGTMDAYEDVIAILLENKKEQKEKLRGNIHFFAGDLGIAQKFLDLSFTLSFTGVITFTHDYDEVIKNVPLDMIMSETDCPFVAPVPYRGKRNEPVYVKEVAKRIAEIKGKDIEKTKNVLLQNARRLFNIS